MLHWLVDNGKLKLEENIANMWPGFKTNGKNLIKVHHVLNHTSGLHNAMADIPKEDPLLMCDWEECLKRMALSTPESKPGYGQLYHYLSFGWLCGGIVEHASGKKFQEVLNEAIIHPLNIEGELYIGIPPGVESRLATLTVDMEDLKLLSGISRPELPSTFQSGQISQMVSSLPILFNSLNIHRAIIPAANGHCSTRALARYYATLAAGGIIPPPHTHSEPALGSHPHIPNLPSLQPKEKGSKSKEVTVTKDKTKSKNNDPSESKDSKSNTYSKKDGNRNYMQLPADVTSSTTGEINGIDDRKNEKDDKKFQNPRIHDAFMGVGDYESIVLTNGTFGLGFKRFKSKDGYLTSLGTPVWGDQQVFVM